MSHLLKPEHHYSDYGTKESNYVVEIDLEPEEQKEENVENEELIEADVREEERQLFVDTSESAVDEETQAETNKIGEKGSIARDMYSGEDNVNDKPRLESESDFPGEAPEEFASTVLQESGMPIDTSPSEPVKDEAENAVENSVEEEAVAIISEGATNVEPPTSNNTERRDETKAEAIVKDAEPVESVGDVVLSALGSDVVVLETESKESEDTDVDVIEEEIEKPTDSAEEYTETASISKIMMKEAVEGRREDVTNKLQDKNKSSERQSNNVPPGSDAPFFEDNISNAPLKGAESFNVKKHEYAPYYKQIKDKIRLYWLIQYGTDHSINQVTKGYKPIVVTFKVFPSGKIENVEIVDSAGNELLASKIRVSIQNTAIGKFPDYINENHIDVKFSYFFF
ncbi:MAG: hypothetical protein GY775_20870 [Candidatus Scalindua sp.]|nr:hypothetical protein [Candidatus Scalindua sp.]